MAIYNTEATKLSLISTNLRFLYQPFGRFSLLLCDYQCTALELVAIYAYHTIVEWFWLIRPTKDLGSVHMDELRTLMDPQNSTEEDASSNEKYACLRRVAERSQGNFRSPMTMPFFAIARPTIPLPSASTSTCPTASRAKGKGKGNTTANVYQCWAAGEITGNASEVAKDMACCDRCGSVELPARHVASGVAGVDQHMRGAADVKDMTRHRWRHQAWKEEVDKLVTAAETEITVELLEVGMWNGRPLTSTTTENGKHDVLEIVWEANELAFRMELEHVDSRKFMQAVSLCFPLGDAPLGLVDLGQANQELADPDWWSRAQFVYALKKVMDLWRISSPYPAPDSDVQFGKTGFTREEIEAFTAIIFAHYIGNFFQVRDLNNSNLDQIRDPSYGSRDLNEFPDHTETRVLDPVGGLGDPTHLIRGSITGRIREGSRVRPWGHEYSSRVLGLTCNNVDIYLN
ncbi:hypothetical protein BDZ89DRAFT_1040266 [Hymenopellis radicata]|nr:hypothetical protein BDZ89DRAFT_1040266 [Hymenopellis radicata]